MKGSHCKDIISLHTMTNFTLRNSTETEFFQRGKVLARLADAGIPLSDGHAHSFEDPGKLSCTLTNGGAGSDLAPLLVSCEAKRHGKKS